jgi:hypothetical protein
MNTSVSSHSARTISLVAAVLTFAIGVSAQSAPPQQVSARKMLYPQRELGDWQKYPVRTIQDISPVPKVVPLDRFGGRTDRYFTSTGCRFYGQQLNYPEVFRAIGKYAGAISINVYGIWQLDAETTEMWERESGKPFMVTEFYAKGEDSGMPNHTGAGWLVHTQDDRGLFYENFVLALLQSRASVGWHWFKYQDNDPDDPHAEASNVDSNKGIVDRLYKPYDALLSRMRDLNLKMYGVADVFDAAAATHTANVDASSSSAIQKP